MQDAMFKLGMSLVKQNIVRLEVLEEALQMRKQDQSDHPRNLAEILVKDFNCEHDSVYREVARYYGFRELELPSGQLSEDRIQFINNILKKLPDETRKLMLDEKILIYKYDPNTPYRFLFVSTDPTNNNIETVARRIGAKRYEVCYVGLKEFDEIIEKAFPPENQFLQQVDMSDIEIETDPEESSLEEEAIDAEINKSLLVNLMEGMLLEAVRRGASDIHIIPTDAKDSEIHFRIDGKLQPWYSDKGIKPEAMAAVVKDRSKNIDRFERDAAQDGFIQRTIDGHMIRFRVSVLPVVGKDYRHKLESVVIRVLDDRNVITDFEKLGFQGGARKSFVRAISKPQGMIILTGPTGSGKSTTLIAALSHVMNPQINVLTVEDPVEYLIRGVRQLKIGDKNTFDQAIRAILRHDPDVVMVGEMRDKQTADIAIKLANTGHLTFSTLHTNDAPSAVSRLYKMGIETFLIAYAINIVIAQRLIRRLCQKCKRPSDNLDPRIPLRLGFSKEEIANTVFYEAVGCDECNGGYKGRVAIHEALYFTKELKNLIFTSGADINDEAIREQGIKDGMTTLRAAARQRVMDGITTIEEIAQATAEE